MKIETLGSLKPSWPKSVVRKWLNIKSGGGGAEEFHSDCLPEKREKTTERRKSCSDRERYVYIPIDLSGGWLSNNGGDGHKRAKVEPHHHPAAIDTNGNLNHSMFVGTWNVGGKPPHDGLNLEEWLRPGDGSPADIYVLGFQEIVPLNAGNVLGAEAKGPAAKWLSLIRQTLNGEDHSNETYYDQYYGDDEEEDVDISNNIIHERLMSSNSPSTTSCTSTTDGRRCMSFGRPTRCNCRICPDQSSDRRRKKNQYCLASSKQMVGIFLCVWVRSDLYRYVNDLRVSSVGTGIMGYLGNKGSVSISMRLYSKSMCFVCTHLTSGEKEGDELKRNSDVMEILKRTRFTGGSLLPETILEHDNVIWLGDLNYRLATAGSNDTFELLEKRDWDTLLDKDQLGIEQRAGRVFEGWEEGRISFAPTYKYIANSDDYAHVQTSPNSKEKRRTPAWCDRILWKGDGLKQLQYSRVELRFSDHRPVYSNFTLRFHHQQYITNHHDVDHAQPKVVAAGGNSSTNIPALQTLTAAAAVVAVSAAAACNNNARVHLRASTRLAA